MKIEQNRLDPDATGINGTGGPDATNKKNWNSFEVTGINHWDSLESIGIHWNLSDFMELMECIGIKLDRLVAT